MLVTDRQIFICSNQSHWSSSPFHRSKWPCPRGRTWSGRPRFEVHPRWQWHHSPCGWRWHSAVGRRSIKHIRVNRVKSNDWANLMNTVRFLTCYQHENWFMWVKLQFYCFGSVSLLTSVCNLTFNSYTPLTVCWRIQAGLRALFHHLAVLPNYSCINVTFSFSFVYCCDLMRMLWWNYLHLHSKLLEHLNKFCVALVYCVLLFNQIGFWFERPN